MERRSEVGAGWGEVGRRSGVRWGRGGGLGPLNFF